MVGYWPGTSLSAANVAETNINEMIVGIPVLILSSFPEYMIITFVKVEATHPYPTKSVEQSVSVISHPGV